VSTTRPSCCSLDTRQITRENLIPESDGMSDHRRLRPETPSLPNSAEFVHLRYSSKDPRTHVTDICPNTLAEFRRQANLAGHWGKGGSTTSRVFHSAQMTGIITVIHVEALSARARIFAGGQVLPRCSGTSRLHHRCGSTR